MSEIGERILSSLYLANVTVFEGEKIEINPTEANDGFQITICLDRRLSGRRARINYELKNWADTARSEPGKLGLGPTPCVVTPLIVSSEQATCVISQVCPACRKLDCHAANWSGKQCAEKGKEG